MGFEMSKEWWSEVGLLLDMVAFWLLSWDLIRSMKGERLARDEILALERTSFSRRYGYYAPNREQKAIEQEAFDARQDLRRSDSDNDMYQREVWAWLAIGLAATGFGMQIYGGWPGVGP